MRVLVIAEAGVNHNGDIEMAKLLVDAAVSAGADVVKFQTFKADKLATRDSRKADYQIHVTDEFETQYSMLKRLELTDTMHRELIVYCQKSGIRFLSSPFDVEDINFLVGIGIEFIKIPSGEITNLPYLRHAGGLGGKIILSTGMSNLGEIEAAIDVLEQAGTSRKNITLLHCTTEYPAPMSEVNLSAIYTLGNAFKMSVGYSDHTKGIEVAIAAVAMGATIIEKHFTLDRNLPGPDHGASLEPHELRDMITAIRNVECALGNGVKCATPTEIKNKVIARKSLVAIREIQAGEIFTNKNIGAKRPGSGISPMYWDAIIGKASSKKYKIDEEIAQDTIILNKFLRSDSNL